MLFYSCHKYVGIIGSEGAPHCSALNLFIKSTIKGKIVVFTYEYHHLFDVTCVQWPGVPLIIPDGLQACLDTLVLGDVGV